MIKKVIIEKAERLQKLPPTPFLEAERTKNRLTRRGVEVIDLGELNPHLTLRGFFIPSLGEGELSRTLEGSAVFVPADASLLTELKIQIGKWLEQRYGLKVKSEKETFPSFGEKKLIYHLLLGFLDPGEKTAVTDPCDPIYKRASILAESEVESIPLLERNDYLPNFEAYFSSRKSKLPKVLFLNYPHNPTTSLADPAFFQEVVEWAGQNNVLVINDASGNEICYEDHVPVSLLQVKGAKKVAVEKFSFFALTGFEFGFLVGDKGIISCVESVEDALGEGVSKTSALLALEILKNYSQIAEKNNKEFSSRKDVLMNGLFHLGWKAKKPKAGPFVWVKTPSRYSSIGFSRMLLRKTGVLVSPGFGFGEYGEGYIRIALNLPVDQIQKAIERIEKHSHVWQRRYKPND